jgi:hypothetical protein
LNEETKQFANALERFACAKGAFENSPQFQLRVCVLKMNQSQRDG